MDTWVECTCRSRCLRQALFFGAATAVAALITATVAANSADDLAGPHRIEPAALAAASGAFDLGHEFIAVECRDAVDTGVAWIETTKTHGVETDRKSTPYWAVPVDGKLLLVRSPVKPSGQVSGVVERLGSLATHFGQAEREHLLRYTLTVRDPRIAAWIALALFGAGTAWLAFLAVRSLRRSGDPRLHPAVARLLAEGELFVVSGQIEEDLASPDAVRHRGRTVTRRFIVDLRTLHFDVRRVADLAWAYKKVTQHRLCHVIPTGKTYAPVLHFVDGDGMEFTSRWSVGRSASQAEVDRVLATLGERAPWAVIGFDDRTQHAWRKQRADFVDSVVRRRSELSRTRSGAR